jgi:hypothetical protein
MTHFRSLRSLPTLALATLAILPLGTIGCSQGSHSPTELEPLTEASALSSASSNLSAVTAESHGADDTGADDRGGNGQGKDDNGGKGGGGGKAPKAPKVGQEFAGAVRAVGAGSLTLANGVKVTVNAQTQWIARGDLFSLSQVSASLAAHRAPRVEGRGARQSDGSIAAASLKAEDNR